MGQIHYIKDAICFAAGAIGAAIAQIYGGWSAAMTTLIICMAIDYITGLIVAGIFHKSRKTDDGKLNSLVGWKGLVRKGITLLIILIAARLDLLLGTTLIKDTAVIAFIANEVISIVENAGIIGIPIPKVILNAISVLKDEADAGSDTVEKLRKKKNETEE